MGGADLKSRCTIGCVLGMGLLACLLWGCHPQEAATNGREEGGESMNQPLQTEGTLLDKRPDVTELATFAMG